MSNHTGSYLMNEVLQLLERRGIFGLLGTSAARELVLEIVRLSQRYDCNPGEIIEGVGDKMGICRYCLTAQTELLDGVCPRCHAEWSAAP